MKALVMTTEIHNGTTIKETPEGMSYHVLLNLPLKSCTHTNISYNHNNSMK